MKHVAIATYRGALASAAGSPGANVDLDAEPLAQALEQRGVQATWQVWDDPDVDWNAYDLTVIRSTWNYTERRDEFLAWTRSVTRLANDTAAVEYSTDKHYLLDLDQRGVPVVSSHFCEVAQEPIFPDGDFVVKPAIGAGSVGAERYSVHDHQRARLHVARLHAQNQSALIQPYVASVDTRGEHAAIFINGHFSHALTKAAMLNTAASERTVAFRRRQMSATVVEPCALEVASAALAGFGDRLLYARVDLVETENEWRVMELELVEPNLFLRYSEGAPQRLATAIAERLSGT